MENFFNGSDGFQNEMIWQLVNAHVILFNKLLRRIKNNKDNITVSLH